MYPQEETIFKETLFLSFSGFCLFPLQSFRSWLNLEPVGTTVSAKNKFELLSQKFTDLTLGVFGLGKSYIAMLGPKRCEG